MKTCLAMLVLLLVPTIAGAEELPVYDSAAYCKKVAQFSGGSYSIEAGCMDMEQEAKGALAAMTIEPKILKSCLPIAAMDGGSYSMLQGCIDMEMEAKKSLGR